MTKMGCRIPVLSLDKSILSLLQKLKVRCSISTKHQNIYDPPALCFPIHLLLLLKLGHQSCTWTSAQSPAHGTLKVCCPWADFCRGEQVKVMSPCICCRLVCSFLFCCSSSLWSRRRCWSVEEKYFAKVFPHNFLQVQLTSDRKNVAASCLPWAQHTKPGQNPCSGKAVQMIAMLIAVYLHPVQGVFMSS